MYWERDIDLPEYTFYLLGESDISDSLLEQHSKCVYEDVFDYEQHAGFSAFEQSYLNEGGVHHFIEKIEREFCENVEEEYIPVTKLKIYSRIMPDILHQLEEGPISLESMDDLIPQIIQGIDDAHHELHIELDAVKSENPMNLEANEREEALFALTVPQLKRLCRDHNMRVGGSKSELVARLMTSP